MYDIVAVVKSYRIGPLEQLDLRLARDFFATSLVDRTSLLRDPDAV